MSPDTTKPTSSFPFTIEQMREAAPILAEYTDEQIQTTLAKIEAQKKAERLARQRKGIQRKREASEAMSTTDYRRAIQEDEEFGHKLAFALADTGKFSIREISKEVAKYGLVGRDGEPLLPGTLWRILQR